jgi:small subunit ribosomal protein S2
MPYINQRWLGGTLTNWVTIKQRIDYLLQLERRMDAGEFNVLSKKERLTIQREIDKLNRRIGGTNVENLAVIEANKLKLPVMAMVDTNSNPDLIDYVIPSNDDAIRAIKLVVSVVADAVEEGLRIREVDMAETGQVSRTELAEMEQYLGPSTLAKLQATEGEDEEMDVEAATDEIADEVYDEAGEAGEEELTVSFGGLDLAGEDEEQALS